MSLRRIDSQCVSVRISSDCLLQHLLEEWFPDGRVFLHLGRFLMLPNNKLWLRITQYYRAYLAGKTNLVGFQVSPSGFPRCVSESVSARNIDINTRKTR